MTRSLVKKLLHEPTQRLRTLDDRDAGLRHVESLRYLFGLAEAEGGLSGQLTGVRRGALESVLREPSS